MQAILNNVDENIIIFDLLKAEQFNDKSINLVDTLTATKIEIIV